MRMVRKRDEEVVGFDPTRISKAIENAFEAVDYPKGDLVEKATNRVVGKLVDGEVHEVEHIQDLVERTLVEMGLYEVSKAYILYREHHASLRRLGFILNGTSLVDDYLGHMDWRIKENSNMSFSIQGLNNHLSSIMIKNYWLNKLYPDKIRRAHEQGDMHIHDLGMLSVYCCGWSVEDLLMKGFGGVVGKVESAPPKHFSTALGQIVNFFYTMQGESAGAQAFANFDTYLAPFVAIDKLSYEQVKQAIQGFVFNLNVPTRVGFQTPFTNLTMDMQCPEFMKNMPAIIGGKPSNMTLGSFQDEMDMINRAFAEVMMEGDAKGRIFTFPIPTYNISKEFDWENPKLEPIWEMTAKYGIPYFSNFVNSDMKPEDARSMCCRLRLDNTELRKRGGGLFGSNPLTGSTGVVTINLPRLGHTCKNDDQLYKRLAELMDMAKDSLVMKRKVLENFTEGGLYPYSKHYLQDIKEAQGSYWANHFSTIGLVGMNEFLINYIEEDITTKGGIEKAIEILDFMRDKMEEYQVETNSLFNLEATPAEGTSHRLARLDKERYPKIKVANQSMMEKNPKLAPYYTNSTQLPVNYTSDVFKALDLQDQMQTKYTGGTVFHMFLGERAPDKEAVKSLVQRIAHNYELPYYTLSPTFSICQAHGYIPGEKWKCPECGERTEVYSRIVGYVRPVQNWNDGKLAEFQDRIVFEMA